MNREADHGTRRAVRDAAGDSLPRHPPARLRIVADDLTGALDSAAAFGAGVPVHLDRAAQVDDTAIGVVATGTRDVPPQMLADVLAPSLPWWRAARLSFKKVDSLLRGNTFAECAWLARAGGFSRVVFAPALPGQGRLTLGGRLLVRQPGSATMLPAGPPEGFAARLAMLGVSDAWVPDVADDGDLDAVAALSLDARAAQWLWCGSAGLAHALMRAQGIPGTTAGADDAAPARTAVGASAILLVTASRHPVLRAQWQRMAERYPDARRLNCAPDASLVSASDRPGAAADGRSDRPNDSRIVAVDLAPSAPLPADTAAMMLARALRDLVATTPAPSALVVVGGDTLLAICRALGATALVTESATRAGWGSARLIGGRWDGVRVRSRSGAFGDEQDLADLLAPMLRSGT